MADAPEFDPSKPFETVNSAPEFDPSRPHEIVGGEPTWGKAALDVGKQVATSPVRVAEGLATGPAQLLGLAGQGANYLTTGKAEQPSPTVTGWEQKLRNFGHGILPQIFQTAEGQERPLQELVTENKGPYGLDLGSGSKGINQYLPQPETKLGEYGRTITDMTLAGAAQPGSILRKVAEGAGAGLASEAAGQATKGTELEPYARMAGALVGGYPVAKTAQIGQNIRRATKTPTTVELHDASDAAYKAARGMKVQYDEHATLALERNIQRDLLSDGYRPGAGMSTFDRIEELTAAPQTKNPTFADIEGVRRALDKVAGERSPAPPFGPTPNASAAMRAIDHIDDFLADSTNAARGYEGAAKRAAMLAEEGRGNWAAMRRSETIEHAANKGELEAAAAGSGANIENRLRAQIKNILVSPKKSRGFTPEDRVIMRDMVKGDFSRNSARLLGKMAMTGIVSAGGVQYLASTMGLGALGHIFLPVAGHISKKVGDISMRHAYQNLAANLRAASPLGQSRNIPEIGLPPSGKAALLRAEVAGQEGFKKGGRVTKTFRYGGKALRRQGGGPTSTGEPPGGMFQQPAAPPAEPPPWESGLTNGAAPAGVNLPQGMYYGVDPGWMSGGGPGTGEPDRPAGRAAFSSPGVPTDEFAAANRGLLRSDLASPLDYTSEQYTPRDTGGFYSIDELYSRTQPPVALPLGGTQPARPPDIFAGQGGMSTNNWRLLGMGPGWIMRNGQLINTATPQAKQGLPFGADPSFSDTAESGMANYQRRVNPGGALTGRNKYDAYYWPGAEPWGYTRWPYQTDV